jgi:inosine/xanthosine triphosphatase
MIIGIGTKNPAKIKALTELLDQLGRKDDVKSFDVPSGVSAMPMSDSETRQGAINRARAVIRSDRSVTIGIGLEGGVSDLDGEMFLCNWGAAADRNGQVITAGGARILLPDQLADGVRSGHELGEVAERYTGEKNISQHGGTIGFLTEGMMSRTEMFQHVLKLIDGLYQHIRRKNHSPAGKPQTEED